MAKAKAQQVKKKSAFWPKVKQFFRTLVSNDAVIEMRDSKWYPPLIIAFVSVLIAAIPGFTNYLKQSGGDTLGTPAAGVDTALIRFSETLNQKQLDVVMNAEDGTLYVNNEAWDSSFATIRDGEYHVYAHTILTITSIMETEESIDAEGSTVSVPRETVDLQTYPADFVVYNLSSLDSDALKDLIIGTNGLTAEGLPSLLNRADYNGSSPYAVSSLFLGKNTFLFVKLPNGYNLTNAYTYREYSYASLKQTVNLRDLCQKDPYGAEYAVKYDEVDAYNINTYVQAANESWKNLFKDAWNDTRISVAFGQTGIWLAIYVGAVAFLGLVVFLFTRGKQNPFSIYTIGNCYRIALWSVACPAIVSLLLGFMMASYAQMFFVMISGMRILWMAFRSLRPQYE